MIVLVVCFERLCYQCYILHVISRRNGHQAIFVIMIICSRSWFYHTFGSSDDRGRSRRRTNKHFLSKTETEETQQQQRFHDIQHFVTKMGYLKCDLIDLSCSIFYNLRREVKPLKFIMNCPTIVRRYGTANRSVLFLVSILDEPFLPSSWRESMMWSFWR